MAKVKLSAVNARIHLLPDPEAVGLQHVEEHQRVEGRLEGPLSLAGFVVVMGSRMNVYSIAQYARFDFAHW